MTNEQIIDSVGQSFDRIVRYMKYSQKMIKETNKSTREMALANSEIDIDRVLVEKRDVLRMLEIELSTGNEVKSLIDEARFLQDRVPEVRHFAQDEPKMAKRKPKIMAHGTISSRLPIIFSNLFRKKSRGGGIFSQKFELFYTHQKK